MEDVTSQPVSYTHLDVYKRQHLHLDCCRVDNDGKTNDVHEVHIRAIRAAEIINARHGWEQPQEVREMRQQDIDVYKRQDIHRASNRRRPSGSYSNRQ